MKTPCTELPKLGVRSAMFCFFSWRETFVRCRSRNFAGVNFRGALPVGWAEIKPFHLNRVMPA